MKLFYLLFKSAVFFTLLTTFTQGLHSNAEGSKGKSGKTKGKSGKSKGKNGNRECPTFGDPKQVCMRGERCSCECVSKPPASCPLAECEFSGASAFCGGVTDIAVSMFGFDGGFRSSFLGTLDYSACPIDSNVDTPVYDAASMWRATFSPPVNAVLLYIIDSQPGLYTFDQPVSIESGLNGASVMTGSTLVLPGILSGIVRFDGSPTIPSLAVTSTTANGLSSLYFSIPP